MLKAFIIDDEVLAIKSIQLLLDSYNRISVTGIYQNPLQAIKEAVTKNPDIIFIDIEMPEMSGIYVAEQISMIMDNKPAIVFVTAYNDYGLKAFEMNAIDYILKPISPKRFADTINRIEEKFIRRSENINPFMDYVSSEVASNAKKIFVYEDRDVILLDLDEILYFESLEDGVHVITKDRDYRTKNTLEYFETRLPIDCFFRCHRSYIVNIIKIRRIANMISTYNIILKGYANPIPLSKSKVKKLKKMLQY